MSIFEFFSAPRGTAGNALLNWEGAAPRQILSYAWVYRQAAMNLIAFRAQQPPIAIDDAALPIVFLYRHALELYLKAIVYQAAIVTINEQELKRAVPRLWREHSLRRLVKMAEPLLADPTHPLVSNGELHKELCRVASEIDEIDPGSYSFRYPVTSQGDPALPSHVFLNIFVLSDAMEKILDDSQRFCLSLANRELHASGQMKFVLHPLIDDAIG
jgi:hypothetical protein